MPPFSLASFPPFTATALLALGLLTLPDNASAWGSGHDDILREVFERLPDGLLDTLTPEIVAKAIHHQSHYPDNFDPFLPEDIGEISVERLAEAGVKRRYDIHSERGIAMAFIMLVDALKEENPERTALWIAAYTHAVADMAACNHDPIVHTATYGWAEWKLKLPGGKHDFSNVRPLLDLSGSARDPAGGKKAFQEAVERLHLEDAGHEPADVLAEIMLYGQTGADFCGPRGVRVLEGAAGWVDREDPDARTLLWNNIGELGAFAVVRALRDIEIARRFAESDEKLSLTPEIETSHRADVARFIAGRKIEDDALFAPLLRDIDASEESVTGIVFEPCWAMNGAILGFASRVQSAAIARSWQSNGTPYATLDLRNVLLDGLPSPEHMPRLVIVATSYHNYHSLDIATFDRQLQTYLDAGGHVIWITGTGQPPAVAFASFRKAMLRDTPNSKLPVSDASFLGAQIRVVGSEVSSPSIAHSATTKAGWQQPFSPWTFDLDKTEGLLPLMTLNTEGRSLTVGAIDAAGQRACLPVYAITPYLFGGEDTIASPHQPTLDSASGATLDAVLQKLGQ